MKVSIEPDRFFTHRMKVHCTLVCHLTQSLAGETSLCHLAYFKKYSAIGLIVSTEELSLLGITIIALLE